MSSIIYRPQIFDVRLALGQALFRTAVRTAADFIAGAGKEPVYYAGVFTGEAAIATSIPNAAITLYVVAESVDAVFFKSPNGSLVDVYIDGIAVTSINTFSLNAAWETIQIATGLQNGKIRRVDVVNRAASTDAGATGIPWLAMSFATLTGTQPKVIGGENALAYSTIAIRLRDTESDTKYDTIPVNVPTGLELATYQGALNAVAPLIDALTDSAIVEATLTIPLTLPAGLDSEPTNNVLNERGGLITFDTTGPRRDSVRIPGIKRTIMSGDSFVLADAGVVAAFVTWLTTNQTINSETVRAKTPQDYNFVTALKGSKSLRRR